MQAVRRASLRRKPLSDCTNIVAPSSLPRTPLPSASRKPASVSKSDTSTDSSSSDDDAQNPGSVSRFLCSTSPPQPNLTSVSGCNNEVYEVYTRRRSAEKRSREKAVSGSSIRKTRNIREQKHEDENIGSSKRQRGPQEKKQHQDQLEGDASEESLSAYIEQQRAYFEGIDAEELEEQVQSDNESRLASDAKGDVDR